MTTVTSHKGTSLIWPRSGGDPGGQSTGPMGVREEKWQLQQKRLKMPAGHAFGQGNVRYSPRRPKYGSGGVREEKWRLQQKHLKMPAGHAFGQGIVRYSTRRPKYGSGGGPGRDLSNLVEMYLDAFKQLKPCSNEEKTMPSGNKWHPWLFVGVDDFLEPKAAITAKTPKNAWWARVWPRKREL